MTKARDLANGGFGLVLVKPSSVVGGTDNGKGTVSFSAATSVSLNNVFSSIYKNYRVMVNLNASTAISLSMRIRNSNSDISTSIYQRQSSSANNTSMTAGRANSQTSWLLDDVSQNVNVFVMDFFSPADSAQPTSVLGLTGIRGDSASNILIGNIFSTNTYNADTGFSLLPSSGNITGSISVYGFNN